MSHTCSLAHKFCFICSFLWSFSTKKPSSLSVCRNNFCVQFLILWKFETLTFPMNGIYLPHSALEFAWRRRRRNERERERERERARGGEGFPQSNAQSNCTLSTTTTTTFKRIHTIFALWSSLLLLGNYNREKTGAVVVTTRTTRTTRTRMWCCSYCFCFLLFSSYPQASKLLTAFLVDSVYKEGDPVCRQGAPEWWNRQNPASFYCSSSPKSCCMFYTHTHTHTYIPLSLFQSLTPNLNDNNNLRQLHCCIVLDWRTMGLFLPLIFLFLFFFANGEERDGRWRIEAMDGWWEWW